MSKRPERNMSATYEAIKEKPPRRNSTPNKVKALLEDPELSEQFWEDAMAHCTITVLADKYEISRSIFSQNKQLRAIITAARAEHKAALQRKIAELALRGDKDSKGIMSALIFSLKNLCEWSDDGLREVDDAPDGVDFEEVT